MSLTSLILDIETVPLAAAMAEPYPRGERSAPNNYKDSVKIAEWFQRDEANWKAARAKECALNPLLGRVVCLAMHSADAVEIPVIVAKTEADEANLLTSFWKIVALYDGQLVTWNGKYFDVRFLITRSLILGVQPTVPPSIVRGWLKKYSDYPHFDVRAVLTNYEKDTETTLGGVCKAFGVEHNNGITGADVYALYQAGDFESIGQHCADDVQSTAAIYQRVAPMFAGAA